MLTLRALFALLVLGTVTAQDSTSTGDIIIIESTTAYTPEITTIPPSEVTTAPTETSTLFPLGTFDPSENCDDVQIEDVKPESSLCECISCKGKCLICDAALLDARFIFKNPLFNNPNTIDPTDSTPTLDTTTAGSTVRPNFVGHWDALSQWQQLGAGLPVANCDSPWVAYEKRRLQRKNRRKHYGPTVKPHVDNNENSWQYPLGRHGPCAENIPPLYY